MTYVLDTSAILEHFRGEQGWERVQELTEDGGAVLFIASVSLTEFLRRLYDLGFSPHESLDIVTRYAMLFEIAPIDEAVAMKAASLGWAATDRVPLVDCLITAENDMAQPGISCRNNLPGVKPASTFQA